MALTRLSGFSGQQALQLYHELGSATAVYEHRNDIGDVVSNCSPRLVAALKDWGDALRRAEVEQAFCQQHGIKVLPIFKLLQERGNISEHDMFNTYNMGVGMTVVVPKADAHKALKILHDNGEDAYVIGYIAKGEEKIELC